MFCQQCGTQIEDGLAYCTNCGVKQINIQKNNNQSGSNNTNSSQTPNQSMIGNQFGQQNVQNNQQPGFSYQGYAQPNSYAWQSMAPSSKSVSFGEAIKLYFINYANFTGRSTKGEYWWAFLFNFLVSLATAWIPVIGQLIALGLLIPGLSVGIRRLHDTGKSWVYILMGLIPLAGFIIIIVQYCKDSDVDNKWGPAPKR